jgi:hypothetical protein
MTKRFQRVNREHVRLTERDLQIVQAVFEARYLTNQMITRLLFKPTTFSTCKQRLRYLYDLGYLAKRKAYVNEPDVYYLGPAGKRYIVSLGEYSQEDVNRVAGVSGRGASAPLLMMSHDLTLSRLYVNARLECASRGWTLRWRNTRLLERQQLGVEPDAWLQVRHGERTREAYVEFTAVMPTRGELASKIARYEAHWEGEERPTPVLWLTTSRSKQNQIQGSILHSVYKAFFLLGLIEESRTFLTGRIWWWSEAAGMVPWIRPAS